MKFQYIVLADNVGRAEDGNGFTGEGDWLLLKCFYEGEFGYGEFYINLNKKTGEGEIACKDIDYDYPLCKAFEKTMKGLDD